MDVRQLDTFARQFTILGTQTRDTLVRKAGPPEELFRGRGWRTDRWGDLEVTFAEETVQVLLLESLGRPPRSPLLETRLDDFSLGEVDEARLRRYALEVAEPARIVTSEGTLELRTIGGFSLTLADGTIGFSWARSHAVGPIEHLSGRRPSDIEKVIGLAIGHADRDAIQDRLTNWGDASTELRWAATVGLGLRVARGEALNEDAEQFIAAICEDARWAHEFHRASGTHRPLAATVPSPEYQIGQRVATRSGDAALTPRRGTIWRRVWHYRDQHFNYYLEVAGRLISRRYAAWELTPEL